MISELLFISFTASIIDHFLANLFNSETNMAGKFWSSVIGYNEIQNQKVLLIFFMIAIFCKIYIVSRLSKFQFSKLYEVKTILQTKKLNDAIKIATIENKSLTEEILISAQHLISYFLSPLVVIFTEVTIISAMLIYAFYQGLSAQSVYLLLVLPILWTANKIINNLSTRLSDVRSTEENAIAKLISSVENHIIEIKVNDFNVPIVDMLKTRMSKLNEVYAQNVFLNLIPRQIIEGVLLSILAFVLYASLVMDNFALDTSQIATLLPIGVRLVPSAGRLMGSFQNISFAKSVTNSFFLGIENQRKIDFYPEVRAEPKLKILEKFIEKGKPGLMILCGKSGSGKTTLLEKLCHRLISKNFEFCYVAQQPYIHPGELRQNVNINDDRNFDAGKLIGAFGLTDLLKRQSALNAGGVSGGEKVRIGIIRALCSNKKIIIMDEPTNALDNKNKSIAINHIKNLSALKPVIIVTHENDLIQIATDKLEL